MPNSKIRLAIVGVGKIVRDQHLPSISVLSDYELVAAASRNATVEGIANYKTIDEMLEDRDDIDAVALCMPPQYRYDIAKLALSNGLHVLLEKPPGATVAEVQSLYAVARENGVSLFATWHSRYACAVEAARKFLVDKNISKVQVDWCEDVYKWHPDQEWVWQAGGLGVFDPGINGLSILTYILPGACFVKQSHLLFPANKLAPIAAEIEMSTDTRLPVNIKFDWRQKGNDIWNIRIVADNKTLLLSGGGTELTIDGEVQKVGNKEEYVAIYERFAQLVHTQKSDVDLTPLQLVADAFMMANRENVEAFNW